MIPGTVGWTFFTYLFVVKIVIVNLNWFVGFPAQDYPVCKTIFNLVQKQPSLPSGKAGAALEARPAPRPSSAGAPSSPSRALASLAPSLGSRSC